MSGWLRHFALSAQARTGLSPHVVVWLVIAILAALAALIFLVIAAFIWLADRYDPVVAALVLGLLFLLVAVIALLVCLLVRRHTMERARLELAARSNANWLDPKLMTVGFQIGQAIGWRRLASLAAVAVLAAAMAKEWFGRGDGSPADGEPPPES
jgi:anti-sigma-K factor RskA